MKIDLDNYITAEEYANKFDPPYTRQYISYLCKKDRLDPKAVRVGKSKKAPYRVHKDAVIVYKK